MKTITKGKIIKTLKEMNWISQHWRLKDFMVMETEEKITFSYFHGDMGEVDKVVYYKKDGYTEIYDLDNYYGNTYLYHSLYLPNINGEYI